MGAQKEEIKPKKKSGSKWWIASVILFNCTIGGGLLNLPASVNAAGGLTPGFSLILIYGVLAYLAHFPLVWCSDLQSTTTYQDTVEVALGRPGFVLCLLSVFLMSFLANVYLFVGATDILERVLFDIAGESYYCSNWFIRREFASLMVVIFVIFPACVVKYIDKLKYISGIATVAIFYIAGLVIYKYVTATTILYRTDLTPATFSEVLLALPAISIAYANHFASISVYGRLEPRTIPNYTKAITLTIVTATVIYLLVTVFVVLLFGEHVQANFISSMTADDWPTKIAYIVFALKLSFEIPVIQFVGWTCVESFANHYLPEKCPSWFSPRIQRVTVSIVWVICMYIFATAYPKISNFSSIVGSFFVIISFLFPGMLIIEGVRIASESHSKLTRICLNAGGIFFVALAAFLIGDMLAQLPTELKAMESLDPPFCAE